MGYSCNNNCMHCIRQDNDRCFNLASEEIIKLMDEAKSRGVTRMVLQGGEPTIRKDFFKILNEASKRFKDVQVQSNGRMFSYPEFAEKALEKGATDFCISVHHFREEEHDKFTGAKGSFRQTIKGIKNLVALEQNVKILFIITKSNFESLPDMARLLLNLGVKNFQIGVVNPEGGALNRFKEIVPRFSDFQPYLIEALNVLSEGDANVFTQDIPKCFVPGFEHLILEAILPEAEKLFPDHQVIDYNKERIRKKGYSEKCRVCEFYFTCEGLYKGYLNEYGDNEIKPKT